MTWLTPVLALVGVLVGALFAPWATTRFAWQTSRRAALDRAIAAVRSVDLARNYPREVTQHEIGISDAAVQYQLELPLRGFEKFWEATFEMRSALAALEPYLALTWESEEWQATDQTIASLLAQLKKARRRTLLIYWGRDLGVRS